MLEVERNSPIDSETLTEFFARCGWEEPDAAAKLEWALAASEEWVVCRLDGQVIGFGRSCRLDPVNRVVFDLVVDPRVRGTGLRGEIVRLLTENAGGLEEVSVFGGQRMTPFGCRAAAEEGPGPGDLPAASQTAYLGKHQPLQEDRTD